MTLQQQYNLIKEGKGDKAHFLKNAKFQFPNLFNAFTSYEDSVNVLKGKGLIAESTNGAGGVVTGGREQDWVKIFKQNISEEVKAEERKTSKEVEDILAHNFNYKDDKNIDNVYGNSFLDGFYTEIQDPKNEDKTVDEVKAIVAKNLAKDRLYYTKDGQFGLKGVGYTTEAPGLGTPKEPKGKYKSSGYGDLREGINNFYNPPGFEKPELSDIDKMFTTKYKGNGIYVIYKNGEEVKTIEGEGNANAWINNEKRKLKRAEPENTFLEPGEKQTFEPIPTNRSQAHTAGSNLRASIARSTEIDKLKEAIREIILQELTGEEADAKLNKAKVELATAMTNQAKEVNKP